MGDRACGIVLPLSSLPGPYGIGSMGLYARRFVDFLAAAGQKYWQILPLGPTGFGDSPYQSPSSSAGNPYLIDLDSLAADGLLTAGDLEGADFGNDCDLVDYGLLWQNRLPALRRAFERGGASLASEIEAFRESNKSWLPDYALFMAIKSSFGHVSLKNWPDSALLAREPSALKNARAGLADEIAFHEFVQYLFWRQWVELKDYANEKGVLIIGDLPIYVSEDSAEVWARPGLFRLKAPGKPALVAGVPPDFYSATGQLWGNPLYDWDAHSREGYRWWLDRLRHARASFDLVRIDHFRGFYNYWEVRAGARTAMGGRWRKGPGLPFVELMKKALPAGSLIAEDLGDLDGRVRGFFRDTGLPGMKVLVYAFDPDGDSDNLPHNIPRESTAYTSTHDSPTFVGWLAGEADSRQREMAYDYLRLREDEGLAWGAMRAIWGSPARIAMAPLADALGLGEDGRINTPSTLGGRNWRWRVREEALNGGVSGRLLGITKTYRRF